MAGNELQDFNDIYIKHNDLTGVGGPTVMATAHNEMYFLPAWLKHYRDLGCARFIVLDDHSTDGTFDYLKGQPDVMVVGSHRRFGDTVEVIDRSDPSGQTVKARRMPHIWRMLLPETFTVDRWAVQVALDEFLVLPPGATLPDIFDRLKDATFDCIPGRMLDVYPRDMSVIGREANTESFDINAEWFFDAVAHNSNSRARLVHQFITRPEMPLAARVRDWIREKRTDFHATTCFPKTNEASKFSLVRWRHGAWMRSAHHLYLKESEKHHVPILHMKFTSDLYRRAQTAIREKSYYKGSAEYVEMMKMIEAMEACGATFKWRYSRRIDDIDAFIETGLLAGFGG
jgi:hypothetical protein